MVINSNLTLTLTLTLLNFTVLKIVRQNLSQCAALLFARVIALDSKGFALVGLISCVVVDVLTPTDLGLV